MQYALRAESCIDVHALCMYAGEHSDEQNILAYSHLKPSFRFRQHSMTELRLTLQLLNCYTN